MAPGLTSLSLLVFHHQPPMCSLLTLQFQHIRSRCQAFYRKAASIFSVQCEVAHYMARQVEQARFHQRKFRSERQHARSW